MAARLDILFYIGIIVPTTITIGFFIGFLVCWFQCNLKQKLLNIQSKKRGDIPTTAVEKEDVGETMEKASQHSADSAIDVNELEVTMDEREGMAGSHVTPPHTNTRLHSLPSAKYSGPLPISTLSATRVLTEADVHASLCKGIYPSHEKLNDEINSEPRIYESMEDIELAIYNRVANSKYPSIDNKPKIGNRANLYRPMHRLAEMNLSAPRLLSNKRTSYSGPAGSFDDNHVTDYGFAPWQRPNSVCGDVVTSRAGLQTILTLPKTQYMYTPSNIKWNAGFLESGSRCSLEILHV